MSAMAYITADKGADYQWIEHVLVSREYRVYNPLNAHEDSVPPGVRFWRDMHMLSMHCDSVVTMEGWYNSESALAAIASAKALDLPVFVLVNDPDPKVCFVLVPLDQYESAAVDEDWRTALKESMDRHPAGSKLADDCLKQDAEEHPAPSAREIFEKTFGAWVADGGGVWEVKQVGVEEPIGSPHTTGGHIDVTSPWPVLQRALADMIHHEVKKQLKAGQ